MEKTDTGTREYTVQFTKSEQDSIDHFVDNMTLNKAYHPENPGSPEALAQLEVMRARYVEYRGGWRGIPNEAIARGLHETFVLEMKKPPQSLDVETASLCDLACPHCFRQYIVTPDKIISEALFRRVIDQAVEMGVPSVKFNWRGEPLMCPKLPEFVAYAKEKGILETIINTNAVTLTEEKSRALIDAGLDMMVYSFDGGTDKTYNKMRVGRFNGDGRDDLAVSSPFEDLKGKTDVGVVHIIYGSGASLDVGTAQRIYQGASGVKGGAEVDDRFGQGL